MVPEYYFNEGHALSSRAEKHAIYRALEATSAAVPNLIIVAGTIAYQKGLIFKDQYSVCPILFGGQIVKKLYKADADGHYEVNGRFRTKDEDGKGTPLAPNVDGLSIGLDICLDYNNGRLRNWIAADAARTRPDIHIQISGSNIPGRATNQARQGGLYLHCDLGTRGTYAWTVQTAFSPAADAQVEQIQPSQVIPHASGRTEIFSANI